MSVSRRLAGGHPIGMSQATPDPFERGDFLTITGIVDSEDRLFADLGFRVSHRRRIVAARPTDDEGDAETIILEFLDAHGELLTQAAIPLGFLCAQGGAASGLGGTSNDIRIFATSVRVPSDDFQFVRYRLGERVLEELARPTVLPTVAFVRTPVEAAGDVEKISWEVSHGRAEIRTIVLYSHDDGESWQAVVPPSLTRSNSVDVCFADLPGGKARLKALATDGFSTVAGESAPFDVPRKGVRPSILAPESGATLSAGSITWFHGQAYDHERQDVALDPDLRWCSSLDGEFGRGPVVSAQLSPGVHEVTLMSSESKASITVGVGRGRAESASRVDRAP
jgi:hypothetical protein